MTRSCSHRNQIRVTKPTSHVCEACERVGDRWDHLCLCMICGVVSCSDYSKNRHAARHFRETGHPIICSAEPGEAWGWCYVDEQRLSFDETPEQIARDPSPAPSHDRGDWPPLPVADWKDTYATLHMYMQIVGKLRLALMPKWNQWWHVPFQLSARGLTTSPIPHGHRTFELAFDFLDHVLKLDTSDGVRVSLPLGPVPVADFYRDVTRIVRELELDAPMWPHPVEVPNGIPFLEDTVHRHYDPEAVRRFFTITRQLDMLFKRFRGRFRGKCSPVHFFWGSFDLAVSRFSGRRAPERPGADPITAEGYDEEVCSLGFWPGDDNNGPLLYSYISPDPGGLAEARVLPEAAFYHPVLKEFVLPYEAVRRASDPDAAVLAFAQSTYLVQATRAGWDIEELRYRRGEPAEIAAGEAQPSP